jgi:GT2 family glycosyltransferase
MMKTVTLAVPTYRRYDLLAQLLIPSAERGTRPPDHYYVVDNGGSLDPMAYGLPTRKTTVFRPGSNLGVSTSWNHGHRLLSEYVIWACDDMELHSNTIEELVKAADANPEVGFFYPQDNAHTTFGVNLLRRWAFEKIGPYDENFYPAYFEDNDYAHRIKLAGVPMMTVPGGMNHVGSATIKSYSEAEMQAHHGRFESLRAYYIKKWGGQPGHEQFKTPFNQ